MAASRPGRIRIVSRPGQSEFAGPAARQLLVARWVPLIVPLLLHLVRLAGLPVSALTYFLTAFTLFLSARTFQTIGSGLGMLVPIQVAAAGLATLLLIGNFLEPTPWLFYCAVTALMMGYVAWFFNMIGSLLPR